MYGDESDGAEQAKPEVEPPVTCKGLELMKVNKTAPQGFNKLVTGGLLPLVKPLIDVCLAREQMPGMLKITFPSV